jgi:Skp family chaperone for outer membrane proteins
MTSALSPRLLSATLPIIAIAIAGVALLRPGLPGEPTAHARMADKAEHPIAICSIPMLVNELMRSERFTDAMEELRDEYQQQLEDIEEQMEELRNQFEDAGPDDPRAQEGFNKYRDLGMQGMDLQRELSQAVNQLQAEQIVEAYTQVRAAAKEIAEDLGYDYLIAAAGEDEELPSIDPQLTLRQMLARPCVLWPDGVDITDEVRDDLNL